MDIFTIVYVNFTPTKFSAVVCPKCEESSRKSRCVGCSRPVSSISGDSAVDESKNLWHMACFRAFHPESCVLEEEPVETGPVIETLRGMLTPTRTATVLPTPEAAATLSNRRRKSWWRPGESALSSVHVNSGLIGSSQGSSTNNSPTSPVENILGERRTPNNGIPHIDTHTPTGLTAVSEVVKLEKPVNAPSPVKSPKEMRPEPQHSHDHPTTRQKQHTTILPQPHRVFYSATFEGLVARMKCMGLVRERMHKMTVFPDCAVAREIVDFLVNTGQCTSRVEGVELGKQLLSRGFLRPIMITDDKQGFADDGDLYFMGVGTPGVIHPPHTGNTITDTRSPLKRTETDTTDSSEPVVRTFAPAILQEQYFYEPRGRAGSGMPFASTVSTSSSEQREGLSPRVTGTNSGSGMPDFRTSPKLRPKSAAIEGISPEGGGGTGGGGGYGVGPRSNIMSTLDPIPGIRPLEQLSIAERQKLEARDIKAGFLVKQGHKVKNWKKRWFVLRGHCLLYYRKPGDTEPAGNIDLMDFFLDKGADPSNPLRIRLPSKRSVGLEYLIQAETPKDFVEWAKAIDGVMKEWEALTSVR